MCSASSARLDLLAPVDVARRYHVGGRGEVEAWWTLEASSASYEQRGVPDAVR